jgi:hypothetical protein
MFSNTTLHNESKIGVYVSCIENSIVKDNGFQIGLLGVMFIWIYIFPDYIITYVQYKSFWTANLIKLDVFYKEIQN